MGSRTITLLLILDVLICPLACGGPVRLAPAADACCPCDQSGPDQDSPVPFDHRCDGSCGGCLCGGAISGEESRPDSEFAPKTSTPVWLPVLVAESNTVATRSAPLCNCDDCAVLPSGAALRALLQSYLL
jgi:hypothetical protein